MTFFSHEPIAGGMLRRHVDNPAVLGSPYLYSVTYDIEGDWAVIKGFYFRRPPVQEFEDCVRRINTETGKLVKYDRLVGVPRTVYQVDPALHNGRIVLMSIPHSDEAKVDGKVDTSIALAHAKQAIDEIERDGHTIVTIGETEVVDAQNLPDLDDLLDNDLLEPGDKVYIFVRRAPKA